MKLIEHLPDTLRDIYELQGICAAGDTELDRLGDSLAAAVGDCFVDSLSAEGCSRWEKMLELTPKATDTLDDRRFRIRAAMNQDTPYTLRGLKRQLAVLCGADGCSVELDAGNYSLSVKVALTVKEQYEEVRKLLARVLPANILAAVTLKYNQHLTLAGHTHGQLAAYTHSALRNEVLP